MAQRGTALYPIINSLKYIGVGAKVTRNIYKFPNTYWILTNVKLSVKDQTHGKAWGRMVWRGRLKPHFEKIGGTLKKQWLLVELPNYQKFRGTKDDIAAMLAEEQKSSDAVMAAQAAQAEAAVKAEQHNIEM